MENAPELTEEMLVQQLTGACEEQIKALWVTSRAHENLFGPLDAEREQESDTLLRLRKVHCRDTRSCNSRHLLSGGRVGDPRDGPGYPGSIRTIEDFGE